MDELDQLWLNMLDAASKRAADAGQYDVADYVRLKVANDTIRTAAVKWLFEAMVEEVFDAARSRPAITVERKQPHSFMVDRSNMVGALLQVQLGVRCLTLEAGWARTPSDGIMRNGSLAHARIRHFGIPRENADFQLIRAEPLPMWIGEGGLELRGEVIRQHLHIFLDA